MIDNYHGIIAKIQKVEQIPNAEKIQVAYVLGEPVIVSKSLQIGYIGVFFQPDTQLSEDYLKHNNLYRHSNKNSDNTKSGFFDDNGKVRAQLFMRVKSCGYFADLSTLSFTGCNIEYLKIGDRIDVLNGVLIAKKYVNPTTTTLLSKQNSKIETPLFKQHVDTEQFKYNLHKIKKGDIISIQAKGHGTSVRYSHTLVIRKRGNNSVFAGLLKMLGVRRRSVSTWEYVVGTRRIVLNSPNKDGLESLRFEILENLKPYLEKGITIYGEIVGYANDKPIMGIHSTDSLKDKAYTEKYGKNVTYSYGCKEGEYKFYAYRVTITSVDGREIDLSEQQLIKWCSDRGIDPPLDLIEPFIYDGNQDKLVEIVEELTERNPDLLSEDYRDPSHILEGVVIRVDNENLTPQFYKNKTNAFRIMEGIYNENNVDIEEIS